LADFLSEGFPSRSSEGWRTLFNAFWLENPAWQPHIPRGWILENESAEILGFIGNIPIPYLIRGTRVRAAASAAWYVKPPWRGIYSLKLMGAFLNQKDVDIFLSTTPSDNVIEILKKLGFGCHPLPYHQTEYLLIVNWKQSFDFILSSLFRSIPRPLFQFLRIALYPLKFVYVPFSPISRKWASPRQGKYDFTLCRQCDDSFTRLWEACRATDTMTLHRDAETLNWLFFSKITSGKRHVFKCTHKENGRLVGYFVYDVKAISDLKLNISELRDIFVPDASGEIMLELLRFSIQWARRQDAALIKIWANDAEMYSLLARNIKIRKPAHFPYFYKFAKPLPQYPASGKPLEFSPSPIEPDRGFS
jgi:hypothetical protein